MKPLFSYLPAFAFYSNKVFCDNVFSTGRVRGLLNHKLLLIPAMLIAFSSLSAQQVSFSVSGGFYNSSFQLTLTTDLSGGVIRFTTNGTAPSASAGTIYTSPFTVNTTSVIRAIAYSGANTTPVFTNTYLFLDSVIRQPYSKPGWPLNSYDLGSGSETAVQDYAMDQSVVNDPAYSQQIITGLKSIPTMSIVMDKTMFWEMNDGEDPRLGSVELLYAADPSKNEQFDCELEAHSHLRLKRSYEIMPLNNNLTTNLFRSAPLNASTAATHFGDTKIVLRGGNNDAWNRNWNPDGTTYTKDEWYRASEIAVSGFGSHGTFVHLYINGIYWGLYNPVERPDEWFDTEFFGGTIPDWLSFSHDGVRSGDPTRHNYLVNTLTTKDMSTATNYNELQQYLNVSEFSDYLILSWMPGMDDWPVNNYYGANRNNPVGPTFFMCWDGEWTWTDLHSSNNGAWVSPYFRNDQSGGPMIAKLWHAARMNPDFMMLFADRVYKNCFNNGAMTDAASRARWATLNNYISTAIIAESARWGDANDDGTVRTKNADWTPEVNRIDNLMNGNVSRFITALRDQGYYPTIDPPTFNKETGVILPGFQLTMTNPNGAGTIYYTTDGSDPRLSGGGLSGSVQVYSGAIGISSGNMVKARVKNGNTWSALHEGNYSIVNLKINEFLASNVAGITDPADNVHEDWIEIYNAGNSPADIGGMYITDNLANPTLYQIPTTNPALTTIAPHGFLLLWADNQPAQGALHVNVKLSKGGEAIGLSIQNGATTTFLDSLTFGAQADDISMGRYPDGSATRRTFTAPTPGTSNMLPFTSGLFINEFLASNINGIVDEAGDHEDWIEIYNSTNVPVNIGGMYVTDNFATPLLYQIPNTNPAATTIPAKGFAILWADNELTEGPLHISPKLGKGGEAIGLTQVLGADQQYIDSLTFGAQTDDVSRGRYPDGGAVQRFFSAPTPGSSNVIPFVSNLYINEFMANNTSGISDESGEKNDWIEIYNNGTDTVNLAGLYLSNDVGNPTLWQIPSTNTQLTKIPPKGFKILWADNQPAQGPMHVGFTLSNTGKIVLVQLITLDMAYLDSVSYGSQTANVSFGRYPDAQKVMLAFTSPTPGASNILPNVTGLFINEFLASNSNDVADDAGDHEDWVEIYNSNSFAVNLAGLFITDNLTNPTKYQIPATDLSKTNVPARGFLVLWCDEQPEQGARHVNIKLSTGGEQIGLVQVNGSSTRFIDSLSFGAQTSDVSEGRLPDGGNTMTTFIYPTPNSSNVVVTDTSSVVSFTLIDATTDIDIRTITNGEVINIAQLPHTQIAIRANTNPPTVGSVKFGLNAQSSFKIESGAPYSLAGDKSGNYYAWNYQLTEYTLTATPFRNANVSGAVGRPKTISFSIINQSGPAVDCNGVTGGTAHLNSCGICVGGNTGLSENEGKDCNGVCNGTALPDDCGICSGGNTGHVANSDKDACGVCFGNGTSCAPTCVHNEVVSFTLMHSGAAGEISELANGMTVNLATTGSISVRANVCDSPVGSVRFYVNGTAVKTESIAPYAINGDNGGVNFTKWNVNPGTYTIKAIPYSGAGGAGTAGVSKTITITIINQTNPVADCNGVVGGTAFVDDCGICSGGNTGHVANSDKDACSVCFGNGTSCNPTCVHNEVVSFTLMHSGTVGEIAPLTNGMTINKAAVSSFSIRANVCDNPVGSVKFILNGSTFGTESTAPYALNGDKTGSYNSWNAAAGSYTLTATPYSESGGNGTAGISETVTFTVVGSAKMDETKSDMASGLDFIIYPNPSTGIFTVEAYNELESNLVLRICNMMGQEIYKTSGQNMSGQYNQQISLENVSAGIYVVELTWGSVIRKTKLIVR